MRDLFPGFYDRTIEEIIEVPIKALGEANSKPLKYSSKIKATNV